MTFARGEDVLLLTDPIDEFMLPGLRTYKGKTLQPVDRAAPSGDTVAEAEKQQYARLLEHLKGKLPEVSDVRLTARLKESAACLVTEGGVSAHLERLMHRFRGEPQPRADVDWPVVFYAFDCLHQDPRFDRLLDKIGLQRDRSAVR